MRVTLINPATKIWIKSRTLPLGLAYIAAVLEKDGHTVEVIDKNIEPQRMPNNPELIGITATTPLIKEAWRIAKEIKEIKPSVYTVLGGPHPSALPDESLALPFIDFVVRGEGEETIRELAAALEEKKDLSAIESISYKYSDRIMHNPARKLINDLDT